MKTIKSISLNFCSGLSLKILIKFLNKLVTGDGFILQSHNNKSYYIGKNTNKKSLKLIIKKKNLYFKLLLCPGLYFGEAYVKGDAEINNGNLSDFLKIILSNVGKKNSVFHEKFLQNYHILLEKLLEKIIF